MATFKAIVRSHHQRKDGKFPVSIRLTHNRQSVYMPTGLYVSKKQVHSKTFEVKDQFVIERTNITIREYEKKLLSLSTNELLSASASKLAEVVSSTNKSIEIISFMEELLADPSFKKRSVKSVLSVLRHSMYCSVLFLQEIDKVFLNQFLRILEGIEIPASKKQGEKRMKKLSSHTRNCYIMSFHIVYKLALEKVPYEYRERYTDPFIGLAYYKGDSAKIDSVSVPLLREFFALECGTDKQRIAKDITYMCFCFGGMNLGDILLLKKSNYNAVTNRITYKRNKIKDSRLDGGITSIYVEPEVKELFDKYRNLSNDEYLFNFNGLRWKGNTSRNFGMIVAAICKLHNLPHLTPYMFRHSVATITRNKCGCSKDDVALLLNHKGPTTVDDAYIDTDWSIIDRTNRKVLDYVFHSDKE